MNQSKSIYLGSTLVEAARGEPMQNALGISFGKSFNNSHLVYNDYFIPYFDHIKKESKNKDFLAQWYWIGQDIGEIRLNTKTLVFQSALRR